MSWICGEEEYASPHFSVMGIEVHLGSCSLKDMGR